MVSSSVRERPSRSVTSPKTMPPARPAGARRGWRAGGSPGPRRRRRIARRLHQLDQLPVGIDDEAGRGLELGEADHRLLEHALAGGAERGEGGVQVGDPEGEVRETVLVHRPRARGRRRRAREAEQLVVARERGRLVAFGRIKPYSRVHELGSVGVLEAERGRGLGELIVRELVRRFPTREVYITTDLPTYFARFGFRRIEDPPPEIAAKIGRVCARLRSGVVAMLVEKPRRS